MNWGIWDKNYLHKKWSFDICIEKQITSFDHADIYGGYTTEAEFGKAFAESKTDRSKIQFISKCGIQAIADTTEPPKLNITIILKKTHLEC
jgi:predicted oxidoreductase